MGETRVDLLHLLEDLRDAYPGALEETIITEIVANSLDSGASTVDLTTDAARAELLAVDDGSGMTRRDLARYHDIAASTKVRGQGIGFAGVGIKLGLLVCQDVLTETRRGKVHVASNWALASRQRAPWKWVPPPGLVAVRGTAVRLRLQHGLSPLVDPGFIEAVVRRHFHPLLDPYFIPFLRDRYGRSVTLSVNGRGLAPEGLGATEAAPLVVRLARKRKPSAIGYLIREPLALPDDRRGVAISTFGKVIKRGWDWLGITPAHADRVAGIVEAPALAECLTLNKADFIRVGTRGAVYLAYRKALQEAVSRQLAAWGDTPPEPEQVRRRSVRPLGRDVEAVLLDLVDQFPLLSTLTELRAGGQKRLPMGRTGGTGNTVAPVPVAIETGEPAVAEPTPSPPGPGSDETALLGHDAPPADHVELPGAARGPRRPARHALSIQFESRPGDPEMARLLESTVWVNAAHPAYRRAATSRAEGYHVAVSAAMALAPLAVEPARERSFVRAFLKRWGEAIERRRGRGQIGKSRTG